MNSEFVKGINPHNYHIFIKAEDMSVDEAVAVSCYHCGEDCDDNLVKVEDKSFCCVGCKTVYEILSENDMCTYYDFEKNNGVSLKAKNFTGKYDYLSSTEIENQLLEFKSDEYNKITFFIPSVHCSSCVWLLESFNKVLNGVITTRLDFVKKRLSVAYNPKQVTLKEVVELLATLGYEPIINLESTNKKTSKIDRGLILRLGVVGFCFGNIMLLSFPEYFNLDIQNSVDSSYQKFFLYLNFVLALPVFFYGASGYLKGAYVSLKENLRGNTDVLSVDIPIMLGISALFIRSTYETFAHQTSGYWDSLAGLVFFLLAGKYVQQVTFKFLSFERDYKSYFPLAIKVKGQGFKNITQLAKNDIIEIHHDELIPADAILLSDVAYMDYSFVTGESLSIKVAKGELVYAGGKHQGAKIELMVEKAVSQSYLIELWNNDAFTKEKELPVSVFSKYFSKYFTYIAIGVAVLTGLYWSKHNPELVWPTVTAVLMVACPCALTLAMPFVMNATLSIFSKNGFFPKNQDVVQLLSEADAIVFDKTGTLTSGKSQEVEYKGDVLLKEEQMAVKALVGQSTHPLSKSIYENLNGREVLKVEEFKNFSGQGIVGRVNDLFVRLGSSDFLKLSTSERVSGQSGVEINGVFKGFFTVIPNLRDGWTKVLASLRKSYHLVLASGDNDRHKQTFETYFDSTHFKQSPQDKLNLVKSLQQQNHKVLMIGDGLNDAGALKQSNIGIALSENVHGFSPSCDIIMDSDKFSKLSTFLEFSKISMNTVVAALVLSIVYNFIGVGMAVMGLLSPMKAAIFMPLSSLSVVLFGVGLTWVRAKQKKLV